MVACGWKEEFPYDDNIFPKKHETRSSVDGEGGREAENTDPRRRCDIIILENVKANCGGYAEKKGSD